MSQTTSPGLLIFLLTVGSASAAEPTIGRILLVENVPHIHQKPDFCGEACVAMALQKIGHNADQDFVFDKSELSPLEGRGCYTRELATAVRNIGFDPGPVWHRVKAATAEVELNRVFGTICSDLAIGNMTIVCMHYDDSPRTTEHFSLIVGYDRERDEVIYHEPAIVDGSYKRMARQTFIKLLPLKYDANEWTVVVLPLRPTPQLNGTTSKTDTNADYAQHIRLLKQQLPSEEFHILLEKPFVVIGDDPVDVLQRHSTNTVRWAVDRLKKDYFAKDPVNIVNIWLFKDKESYESNCIKLFGKKPGTPFGYYSSADRALVMNISTGGGTLVHEIVHPFIEANFPECPSWFNEGLASLYEQCRDKNGRITGSTNWRLSGLKEAIVANRVPSFEKLCSTTRDQFYNDDTGTNYAQARYLCYYLQEQNLLLDYYQKFTRNVSTDPSGYQTLMDVLGTQDMITFQKRWEAYSAALKFP